MMGRVVLVGVMAVAAGVSSVLIRAEAAGAVEPQTPAPRNGWTLPASAADETSPLKVNDAVLAAGRKLFAAKCERCHGAKGKGDGPDADTEHAKTMDLTVAARAALNPDGVVFYKIWNGRSSPRMPRFSEELSREQAWAIVAFVQTLRARP
jgi:mono/diheme cytochrome c family protein